VRMTFYGTGSPLSIGAGRCSDGALNCTWWYALGSPVMGMAITYEAGAIADLATSWASALPPETVVTSLDLEETAGAYAMSLARTAQAGQFTPVVQGSVAPDQLQAVASSEGASGRVLTAVSYLGGLVSYISYGWSRDTSSVYEAQVVFSTFDTVAADAAGLAGQGYAITAFGAGNGAANGLVLVGTKLQGNTTPRFIEEGGVRPTDGYAIVGFFWDPATGYRTIAER